MKSYVAAALCATALFSTSCAKDEAYEVDPADAVSIVASISGTPAVSRAAADIPYTPTDGKLSLYYSAVGSEATTAFTYADDKWSSATPLFWNDLLPVGSAYPFFAVAPALPIEAPTAATDQSTLEAYANSDQLVAFTVATERRIALPLTFKHLLSQFKVTLKAGVASTDPAYIDPATATFSIGGVRTAYTISYDGATSAIPAVATVGGDAASIIPSAKAGSFYAVAPAQTFAAGMLKLTFTIHGKAYTWSNKEAITSVAGMNIAINLSVQKTGITLLADGITLTDWDNSLTLDNQTVVVDGLTDGTAEAGNITPADGDLLELAANGKSAVYNFATPAWVSESPLHWDDMPAGASTFDALYTPVAAAVADNEKDYYTGAATAVAFGAPINLKMIHAMSQVAITLKGDDSGLLETITSKSLNIKGLKAITLAEGIALNDKTKAIAFAPTNAYLVAPQALAGTSIKMVSSNGHSYTLKLSDLTVGEKPLTAFEAGKSYAITATVTNMEVTLSVTLKDWEHVATDGKAVSIDGLTDGTLEDSNITPANGDALKLWSGAQAATFTYDAAAWKSAAPIYWSNMPAGASTFSAFYAPIAAAAGSEKDYLIGGAADVSFGSPVNLKMNHAMSQVKVVLVAGTGYANASFLAQLTGRAINLQKLASITDNGAVTLKDATESITGATAFTNEAAYIVAPQLLDNASKTIKLTTAAQGHFYTLKLSDLKVEGAALTAFEAGKSYTITLTVDDKAVSISTNVAPWSPIDVTETAVSLDGLNNDNPAEGNITLVNGDQLALEGANQNSVYLHNGTAWTATAPIYWSKASAGTSTFKALYTPKTAPAAGNEVDHLNGTASAAFGAPINLNMTHAMAQISVNLMGGNGLSMDAVNSVSIQMQPLASINLAGVELGAIETVIDAATFKNNTPYRVAPQALTAANNIKVKLTSGQTYTVDLSTLKDANGTPITSFAAGSNYAIDVTLNDKEAAISTTLNAWNEASGNTAVEIDGLVGGDGSGTFSPTANDKLTILSLSGNKTAHYTYNTSWTSNAPIYWGAIPSATGYGFKALYTPAATPTPGNEKDYTVGGTVKNVAFGAPINLTLNHAMAQVKITLKAGTSDFTDATLVDALTSRAINLQKMKVTDGIDIDGTVQLNSTVASITGTTAFGNATSYIVAPQPLTDANTIVLKLATGYTYTMKLNTVTVGGINLTNLDAGNIYNITVTVNDTGISMGVTITDWNVIAGGGEAS